MNKHLHLLRTLADGRFHSGEALAVESGVSRAAIWKQLQTLRERFDIEIQSVPGRGHRLTQPLELLDAMTIRDALTAQVRDRVQQLVLHQQIDSTNTWLMEQTEQQAPSGTVCLAEQQLAGRGRRGRTWVSPFGQNIYLSLLWHFDLAPVELSGLSLAIGLAVLRALRAMGIADVGLKWPNDILAGEGKLAGLLLEMTGEASGPSRVVIGIGINVRMSKRQGAGIDQAWTDLASIAGSADHSRNRLAARLIEQLIQTLDMFPSQGLAPWIEEWNRFDLFLGKPVRLQTATHVATGRHCGINAQGALLLEGHSGIKAYHAGEISLREAP